MRAISYQLSAFSPMGLLASVAGCGELSGLEETVTPLVRIEVGVTGETSAPVRVALVWLP